MAGVVGRSFASTARAAGRFCGNKAATARNGGTNSAAAAAGRAMPRPSSAPSPSSFNSSSPKSFFTESRPRPGAFFGRLPGEVAMVQSLLPLHNATASARMVSLLRSSAGALLQGLRVIDDA